MLTKEVRLETIEKVKDFVNAVRDIDSNIDIGSGHYIIDGKSIMGILSLDLSKALRVVVHCTTEDEQAKAESVLKPFEV